MIEVSKSDCQAWNANVKVASDSPHKSSGRASQNRALTEMDTEFTGSPRPMRPPRSPITPLPDAAVVVPPQNSYYPCISPPFHRLKVCRRRRHKAVSHCIAQLIVIYAHDFQPCYPNRSRLRLVQRRGPSKAPRTEMDPFCMHIGHALQEISRTSRGRLAALWRSVQLGLLASAREDINLAGKPSTSCQNVMRCAQVFVRCADTIALSCL